MIKLNVELYSIVVLYNPSKHILLNVKNTGNILNGKIIIVTNGVSKDDLDFLHKITSNIIVNQKNVGIAKAINQGIIFAFNNTAADYILLLDQDSVLSSELMSQLMSTLYMAKKDNVNLACVVPQLHDNKGDFFNVKKGMCEDKYVYVDTAATSGQIIPVDVLKNVGLMDDALFIDGVDHEWCFRAISIGYKIIQSPNAVLEHNLGNTMVSFLGSKKPLHANSIRHYYIIRNALLLSRREYIPINWRIMQLAKTIRRGLAYIFFSKEKKIAIVFILHAVRDGVCRVSGEYHH